MTRNFAEFQAALPDDTIWDDDGNPVVPGGEALTNRLRKLLIAMDWECVQTSQHSFYGWSFDIGPRGDHRVLLQYPGPWLLTIERHPGWWRHLMGRPDDRVPGDLIQAVRTALESDELITEIKWFTREEYENQHRPA